MQILGRVIAFSTRKMWKQLFRSGVEYSFACVFLVALNDIEKQIMSKSGTDSAEIVGINVHKHHSAGSAIEGVGEDKKLKESRHETGTPSGAFCSGNRTTDLVMGVSITTPDLNVRAQLAPEIHFLQDEPSFFLISELITTLGLIVKSSPDDFTKLVANSDVMPILQTIFRCVCELNLTHLASCYIYFLLFIHRTGYKF